MTLFCVGSYFCAATPAQAALYTVRENPSPVLSTLIPDQAYVIKDDVNYKLYYAGNDFTSINLAQSPDGVTWTPYSGNPIISDAQYHSDVKFYVDGFTGANGGTDPSALTMHYRMWYQGLDGRSIAGWRYAESPDGIVWHNRMPITQFGVPLFGADAGVAYGIADVVYAPGASNTGTDWAFRLYGNVQWESGPYSAREIVVMAFSANGHDWTGYDPNGVNEAKPIFGPTLNMSDFDGGHVGWFKVIRNSATDWEAFYSGGTDATFKALNGIGYATSTDGISWTRKQTLLTTADGVAWRNQSVWMPSVVKTGSGYDMFFLGSDNADIGRSDWIQWKLGRAVLASDTTPPTISSVAPAAASTGVGVRPTISAVFNEALDPATVTATTFILKKGATTIPGAVTYSGKTATLKPTSDLAPGSTYTATVTTGMTDLSGNALASDHQWTFSTATGYDVWQDHGINYTAPTGDAYYPSVIYDAGGFGGGLTHDMWYSDGLGGVFLVKSSDGISWSTPTAVSGLAADVPHHVQVLYDANCFGAVPCDGTVAKYRIWYWRTVAQLYDIASMGTAKSVDGVNWIDLHVVAQDPSALLVDGAGSGWNRGTYGPASLIYRPGAANTGLDPWNYRYVMYYDGTNGANEETGLAYSVDGLTWSAYADNPVLARSSSATWDCTGAAYGTVFHDANGYHFWYSGGGGDDGSGGCQIGGNPANTGIGYAASSDGEHWTRNAVPVLDVSDGYAYRNNRTYTPSVVSDGSGTFKMYYTAKGAGSQKSIGLATAVIGDSVPPAAVTDLAATAATSSSITLTWTAPGNDGAVGTATSYDIRHTFAPMTTDAEFDAAAQVSGEPVPAAAGTAQTMTVTGLAAGTTYYFAMKTSDEVPNASALSNTPNRATATASSGTSHYGGLSTSLALTVTADPERLPAGGGDVAFTYKVQSLGNLTASNVSVNASLGTQTCAPVTYVSGDTDHDGILAAGAAEEWTFTCTVQMTQSGTNTAVATGSWNFGTGSSSPASTLIIVGTVTAAPNAHFHTRAFPAVQDPGGGTSTIAYSVGNLGDVPISDITFSGDFCTLSSLLTGDVNGNGLLDPGEEWQWTCTGQFTETSEYPVVFTGMGDGVPISDSSTVFITVGSSVPQPDIHLHVLANPTALPFGGGSVYLEYSVFNDGNTPLTAVGLSSGSETCTAPTYVGGDVNKDNVLDLDEIWTYVCLEHLHATEVDNPVVRGRTDGLWVSDDALSIVSVAGHATPVVDVSSSGAYDPAVATSDNVDIDTTLGLAAATTPPPLCIVGVVYKIPSDQDPDTQHDSTVYYCGRDGKRHAFPNAQTYATWYPDFTNVKIISETEMTALEIGAPVTYRPGVRLIKIGGDPKVYAVARKSTLRWIMSEDIAAAVYGPDWNSLVDDIPGFVFADYVIGDPVTSAR